MSESVSDRRSSVQEMLAHLKNYVLFIFLDTLITLISRLGGWVGAGVRHRQMSCLAFLPYLPSTASIIYLVIKYPGGSLGQDHSSQIYSLVLSLGYRTTWWDENRTQYDDNEL